MTLHDSVEDGSDSDTSLSDTPPDYYQPISAVDDEDSDEDHGPGPDSQHLSSANGISSLDLNGVVEHRRSEEEEEEEEERTMQASDSEVLMAFREDERRRNAPLPPENATRVMEAMRGISFGGVAPDWADQVPENRWINQLRRLRTTPPPPQGATENASRMMVEAMRDGSFPN